MTTTKPGDFLADAAAVQAALTAPHIALVVESHCGYPLLLTVDEHSTVIAKSPGDDYPVYDDDQCCWPYRVVWTQPGD